MKQLLLSLTILLTLTGASFAQNRAIARGAEPGELYLTTWWYGIYGGWGPPSYSTLRTAVYHLTENGKKATIQYDVDYFADQHTPPGSVMQLQYILADATPGVLYAKRVYTKNYYDYTQLWVTFDYGKNWVLREENMGAKSYSAVNVEGVIFRFGVDGAYKSEDYGNNFIKTEIKGIGSDPGLQYGEGFGIGGYNPYQYSLSHTYNFHETYTQIPIDSQFMCGQLYGIFPDVYRGGKKGEVYIDSWFPYYMYKVSFSSDTGHTFRHVYVNENYQWQNDNFRGYPLLFMSDREPGVFYILHLNQVDDTNPYGWHLELCIEYYRDYGETLEAVFCHDITKDYEYEEVVCDNVTFLDSKVINQNSVQLQWSNSAESSLIRGYHLYRDNVRITSELLTDTIYLDENLSIGAYDYYVKTYYLEGCVSDSSNHVAEKVELGIEELGIKNYELQIYPNPTTGALHVTSDMLQVTNVEVFDVCGKCHASHVTCSENTIDISHLHAGIYFLRFKTNSGTVTKKVIKL